MKITGAYGGASYRLSGMDNESNNSLKELATGKKLNSAADNPAGMAIFQKMESQSKENSVKLRTLQNQISFYQTGDGALSGISENINKLKELSVQVNNGTLNKADQDAIREQVKNTLADIDNSANTEFNTNKMITDFSSKGLELEGLDIASENAQDKIDKAQAKVSGKRGEFGASVNQAKTEITRLRVASENNAAASSKIEDADMLLSFMTNTTGRIKEEASTAVNAQSRNFSQERISSLIKDM